MAESDWASTSVNTDTMSDSEASDSEDDRTESFTSSSGGSESESDSSLNCSEDSSCSTRSNSRSDWNLASESSSMALSPGESSETLSSSESGSKGHGEGPQSSRLLSGLPPFCKEPLYEGADLTILDSFILHYQFALRHSLTKQAFSELIELVSAHIPCSAKSTSVYSLKQFFCSPL